MDRRVVDRSENQPASDIYLPETATALSKAFHRVMSDHARHFERVVARLDTGEHGSQLMEDIWGEDHCAPIIRILPMLQSLAAIRIPADVDDCSRSYIDDFFGDGLTGEAVDELVGYFLGLDDDFIRLGEGLLRELREITFRCGKALIEAGSGEQGLRIIGFAQTFRIAELEYSLWNREAGTMVQCDEGELARAMDSDSTLQDIESLLRADKE